MGANQDKLLKDMNAEGHITTKDIKVAVAALRSRRCTRLIARFARSSRCTRWSDADASRLSKALERGGGANLVALDLRGHLIGDTGGMRLAEVLGAYPRACPNLSELQLDGNAFTAATWDRLVPFVMDHERGRLKTRDVLAAVAALHSGYCAVLDCTSIDTTWGEAEAAQLGAGIECARRKQGRLLMEEQ